jgi:hypothetical protein
MLDEHLLYTRIIGNNGHIETEPTFLGAVLIGIAFIAGMALLVYLAGLAGLL